jgi:hypothetical protein
MEDMHKHTTHPDLVKRLKRAEGICGTSSG